LNSLPKIRRVLDPRTSQLEQLHDPQGRRGERGVEAEADARPRIIVLASYQLGCTLIEHDLVDELRLVVFLVVLGVGERLFGEISDRSPYVSSGTYQYFHTEFGGSAEPKEQSRCGSSSADLTER
jgi:RibD C-terminal domain